VVDITLTYKHRTETRYLIVHDSHTEVAARSMIEWLKLMARKRGLLSIGFHYVVFPDGELVACRPMGLQGSHCAGFDRNSIGVCLIGGLRYRCGEDGEQIAHHCDTFTPEQKAKLHELYAYCRNRYPDIEIRGHTELGHHQKRLRMPGGFACPALDMEPYKNG
jgi:hypothetical protein